MKERLHAYSALLVVMLCVGGLSVAMVGMAVADSAAAPTAITFDRDLEPVIVTGTIVSSFHGVPADELFVYAYAGTSWQQIPSQLDEITAAGAYVATEDGLLDDNDEIVFMAMDLGDEAPPEALVTSTLPISATWYKIEVTDPTSPDQQGWAYLFRSRLLAPITTDYVDFDEPQHRIDGGGYSLALGTTHPGFEYLTLSGSEVDILDRTKIRVYSGLLPLVLTENQLGALPDNLIKDGPVRVILRGGKGLAYDSMVLWNTYIPAFPPLYGLAIRFSTDFANTAIGSTLYNAVVPAGVTVDGITETVPADPLSPWWQLSTSEGTLVQASDTGLIGGEQTNYYKDDLSLDADDTGDQQSYGDIGVYVRHPNSTFTYTFALYSLDGTQPNVGAAYQNYLEHPLSAVAVRQGLSVTIEAEPQSQFVGLSSTITATVVDFYGDPVSGKQVGFYIVSGTGTIDPPITTTDVEGKAIASLTSQVSGSVGIKATAESVDSDVETVTFVLRRMYLPLVLRGWP